MTHIPNEFFDKFPNLRKIHAVNVNLQAIQLRNCGNLKWLDVRQNRLKGLASNSISACTNLESLFLDDNYLTELTLASLSACSNLREIWAENNQIGYLETNFLSSFRNLQTLSLKNNKIKEIRKGTLYTASTRNNLDLFFSRNPIERIEGSFNNSAVIHIVDFNDCGVSSVDPKFLEGFNGVITYLWFDRNKCISYSFQNVDHEIIFLIKNYMRQCFEQFVPSETETPPTTIVSTPSTTICTPSATPSTTESTSTVQPEELKIGKFTCVADVSGDFYRCRIKAELELLDELFNI